MIVELMMALLIGVMMFAAIPLLAEGIEGLIVQIHGEELGISQRVSDFYRSLGVEAFGKLVLVRLQNAGWRLRAFEYEGDGRITTKIGGKKEEWTDPLGRMGRLRGRPFGIAHEDSPVMGSPADAHVAEKKAQQKTKRDGLQTTIPDGEGGAGEYWYNRVGLGNYKKAVDFDYFPQIVQGSAHTQLSKRTKEFTRKGFAQFNSVNLVDYGLILMAFFGSAGIWYLGAQLASSLPSDGGGGVALPLYLAGVIA